MDITIYIILGGIGFGLIGFLIGMVLFRRASKESPSINHYKRFIDILTLRKLRKKGDIKHIEESGEDPIKHYEKMRDKLTIWRRRNNRQSYWPLDSSTSTFLRGFVVIVIGVTLLPMVAEQVNVAQSSSSNVTVFGDSTAWGTTMLQIIPGFFALAILGVAIATVFQALRSGGIV
jgi:hypothetical protein